MLAIIETPMKKALILILFLNFWSLGCLGQVIDTNLLINDWAQGYFDQNDSIIINENRRGGGPTGLRLNSDHSVFYSTGFNCGFGVKMSGKWTCKSDTLILDYDIVEYYKEHVDFDKTPRIEKYKIKKLNGLNLILLAESGSERLYRIK